NFLVTFGGISFTP
ncbi:hypothetical protein ECFRIK1999_2559, partial [Escherichia coli FRIK1999]